MPEQQLKDCFKFTSSAWNLNIHLLPLHLQRHTVFHTQDFPHGLQKWRWMITLGRAEVRNRNSQLLVWTPLHK